MYELNATGAIDPVENLVDRAIYINSGLNDRSVPPHNQEAIRLTFAHFNTTNLFLNLTNDGHELKRHVPHAMLEYIY